MPYRDVLLTFAQGFCIFTANTQVTLADILRSYDRGELCVDDLRAQILQLFKGGDLSVRVEVIKDKIFAQALDTVAISISPQSLIPSGALLPEAEAHTK
jgi:hypothetical protein